MTDQDTPPEGDASPREFVDVSLRDARFVGSDLSGVVMRGVVEEDVDIEAPWLNESPDSTLLVNGVNVAPFVDEQLNTRFPGRDQRRAQDPEGLQAAWAVLQQTWDATLDQVAALPPDTVDESVDGEWSFAETLRHLVMATDMWLGRGVLGLEQPFHPLALIDSGTASDGFDTSVLSSTTPTYDEILAARADRVAMVRDFLDRVTVDELAAMRPNPHDPTQNPDYEQSVLSCLHVILDEEWEHHRYAVRDLDAVAARDGG